MFKILIFLMGLFLIHLEASSDYCVNDPGLDNINQIKETLIDHLGLANKTNFTCKNGRCSLSFTFLDKNITLELTEKQKSEIDNILVELLGECTHPNGNIDLILKHITKNELYLIYKLATENLPNLKDAVYLKLSTLKVNSSHEKIRFQCNTEKVSGLTLPFKDNFKDKALALDIQDEVERLEKELATILKEDYKNNSYILNARKSADFYKDKISKSSNITGKALWFFPWLSSATLGKYQEGIEGLTHRYTYKNSTKEAHKIFAKNNKNDKVKIIAGATGFVVEGVLIPWVAASEIMGFLTSTGIINIVNGKIVLDTLMLNTYFGVKTLDAINKIHTMPRHVIIQGGKFIAKSAWTAATIAVIMNLINSYVGPFQTLINQHADKAAYAQLLKIFENHKQMFEYNKINTPEYFEKIDYSIDTQKSTYYTILAKLRNGLPTYERDGRGMVNDYERVSADYAVQLTNIDTNITVNKTRIDQLLEKKKAGTFTDLDKEEIIDLDKKIKKDMVLSYNITANWLQFVDLRPEIREELSRHMVRLGYSLYEERYGSFLDFQIKGLVNDLSLDQIQQLWSDYINQSYYRVNEVKN